MGTWWASLELSGGRNVGGFRKPNVRQALDLADRAYVLENGRTVHTGTAAELLADDAIQAAYLGL
jgi:ABC-type branched-subunit amino acid transport system ATPase component